MLDKMSHFRAPLQQVLTDLHLTHLLPAQQHQDLLKINPLWAQQTIKLVLTIPTMLSADLPTPTPVVPSH